MTVQHTVIAIDGPAASGKSSVSRAVARRLGFVYVNSGAMYRAITWYVLQKGISPSDQDQVMDLLQRISIDCGIRDSEATMLIDGSDPEPHLCEEAVNHNVSTVAGIQEVRRALVDKQRGFAENHDLVMEGRDIGSAVFPETPYKFYIDASPEIRARRRAAQGQHDEIGARDRYDSSRKMSPLVIAEDAHVIDSSNLTIDGVVGEVIGRLKIKGLHVPA
jgi:CMP/dCMP kinase